MDAAVRDHRRATSRRPRPTSTPPSACRSARWPGATTSAASAAAACCRAATAWARSSSAPTTWEDQGPRPKQGRLGGRPAASRKAAHLWVTRGLDRKEVDESAGDIVWIAGPGDITSATRFSAPEIENPALPPLEIEEPTVSMFFLVNNGPFSGQDGKAVTLRQIKERLERELRVNVALRVEDLGRADGVKVSAAASCTWAILIEEMRREGMELCVSRPRSSPTRDDKGNLLEPMEQLIIDVPERVPGRRHREAGPRKGELTHMHNAAPACAAGVQDPHARPDRLPRRLPDRHARPGHHVSRFVGYGLGRATSAATRGSLVSMEAGEATGYALENLQQRGTLFVSPMDRSTRA
jgi:GTP-binding protein